MKAKKISKNICYKSSHKIFKFLVLIIFYTYFKRPYGINRFEAIKFRSNIIAKFKYQQKTDTQAREF